MKKFYDSCYPDGKFPDSLEPLYSALGKIVYAWNYVEMFTDSCVAIIYHDYDGKAIAENHEIPRSFKNKVKFIKDCLLIKDNLISLQHDGLLLMKRVSYLSKKRNKILHSIYRKSKENSFDFFKYNYHKEWHDIQEFNIPVDDFFQYGNKMMDRVSELFLFFALLHSNIRP